MQEPMTTVIPAPAGQPPCDGEISGQSTREEQQDTFLLHSRDTSVAVQDQTALVTESNCRCSQPETERMQKSPAGQHAAEDRGHASAHWVLSVRLAAPSSAFCHRHCLLLRQGCSLASSQRLGVASEETQIHHLHAAAVCEGWTVQPCKHCCVPCRPTRHAGQAAHMLLLLAPRAGQPLERRCFHAHLADVPSHAVPMLAPACK